MSIFRDYSINIGKQISRLLPFYLRGRKNMLFLQAVSKPLEFFNDSDDGFTKWANRKLLELSMCAQEKRILWYLNNIVVADLGITLRSGQQITIGQVLRSFAIVYSKNEIREQSTAPLFYPYGIPTVTRVKSNQADRDEANILTCRQNETGLTGSYVRFIVPYAGQDRDEVARKITAEISRFMPVGVTFVIEFT